MDIRKKMQCEILVVGGGNAGLVATLEAKNAGVDVLLIEKSPKAARGGNSRFSGGIYRFASSKGTQDYLSLMEGATLPKGEIEVEPYPKDAFYNKVISLSEGFADQRFTEIFVENSFETVKWLKSEGLEWEFYPDTLHKKADKLFGPSGATSMCAKGLGEGLVEMLYGIIEKKGVEVLYGTAARKLLVDEKGAITGVIAKDADGFFQIDAKNVILTCGGFQANPQMRRSFLGENWDLVKLRGTRYNTGDGQRMAMEVGAHTAGHWGGCHASIVSEDSPMVEAASAVSERYSYNYGILVNRDGKRFVNEGEDFIAFTYAKYGKEILRQPGAVAYQIYDAKTLPLLRFEYQNAEHVESDTLEDLADQLDIDVDAFIKTVNEFNDAVVDDTPFFSYKRDGLRTRGLTPDKTNWAQKIDTPPFLGYAVVCGLTMTYGGIKTNEKTQVMDTSGLPIPGLYAVGEITGGFFYHNYPSGTGLVRGAVMGRIAAREAVANK